MLTINDGIQYVLIAALFVAALADRRAHRAYIKVLSDLFASAKAQFDRIEAKLDHKDSP